MSVDLQSCELQLELFSVVRSEQFLLADVNVSLLEETFWKFYTDDRLPKLQDFSFKLCSASGGRYVYESAFSVMKNVI